MSVASEITRIKNNISSAYTACEGKGATLPQTQDSANLADTIESIPTGGGSVEKKDVNFYDWEGTLLFGYSVEEVQAMTSLPAPDTSPNYQTVGHDLLVFQEWTRNLTNIKTWVRNHSNQSLGVGAIYTTTDLQNHNHWNNPRLTNAKSIYMQKRGVTSIGNSAFQDCYSLTAINIPDGVTSIGNNAFQNCCSLTAINIPDGVTSIGGWAFYNCCSLTAINIPDGVTSIGNNAFQTCYSLTAINIPDGVTSIGGSAFYNCYSLTAINIPDSVTTIGGYAFQACYSLTAINIPDGVTSIGNNAFQNCYSLTAINIPDGVTSIGNNAFQTCRELYDVVIHGKPALSNANAFSGAPSTQKIYVPRANLSWFETATNWDTYYSRFVAIEDNIEYLESLGYNVDAYK